jgi:cell division protein FtsL
MFKKILLYALALSIPVCLGTVVWQTTRYAVLKSEVEALSEEQDNRIEENKRLITDIALLSASKRIETIATSALGLTPTKPENITQVTIERGKQ